MTRAAAAAVLILLMAPGLPRAVAAQEPTSEELWRKDRPPFRIDADGVYGPGQAGAAIEMRYGGNAPWFLPPTNTDPARLAALEQAASYSAARLASAGLRAPRITRRDGRFPIYFVHKLGPAAAQYGPGFGQFGHREALRVLEGDWDSVIIVDEAAGFGKDLALFPELVAHSVAHELFHAVQASYPDWSGHDGSQKPDTKWVTEGLPDAIGRWSIEGLSFMGNPPFDPKVRFASGSNRFGMAAGMRPYDYPLDMRIAPPRMPIYVAGDTEDKRRVMSSYMTSSFWSYAWQHSMPRDQAWKAMSRALLLRTAKVGTADRREDALAWTDRSLRENHPAWGRGLYDALPAFIAWWVAYPDEVLESRKGEFAHPRWLQHAFLDGCPLHVLDDMQPTATFTVSVRELAATCVRVKWTGAQMGQSNWPAVALTVAPEDGGGLEALRSVHVGMHGTNLGKSESFRDTESSVPSLVWSSLAIDPRRPATTNGETVITFTNVDPDPVKTELRRYQIHLGVGTATASGQLHKPAEPGLRPASQVQVAARRQVMPGMALPLPEGKVLSMRVTPSPIAGEDDCRNATAKAAGLVALGLDKSSSPAGPLGLMSICVDTATSLTRESLRPARQPEVTLRLPAVPDGHAGPISGGEVIATWTDPALGKPGDQHVDARTSDVQITISQANPAFVSGRFVATFTAPSDTANGKLSGDFLTWRVPTDQRIPHADPIDYASSDLLQTFAAMGKDPAEMRAQLGRRSRPREREREREPDPPATGVGQPCPLDCESLQQGKVSPACRQQMQALYDACPASGATGAGEVKALATWLYRDMPEPMRAELIKGTVETMMASPSAIREDWVRKVRAMRAQAGN